MYPHIYNFRFVSLIVIFTFLVSCSPTKPKNDIISFHNYPNPFDSKTENTTYKVTIEKGTINEANVEVYDDSGDLLASLQLMVDSDKKNAWSKWQGLDKNGKYLPSSIYTSKVILKNDEGATFISQFKTFVK